MEQIIGVKMLSGENETTMLSIQELETRLNNVINNNNKIYLFINKYKIPLFKHDIVLVDTRYGLRYAVVINLNANDNGRILKDIVGKVNVDDTFAKNLDILINNSKISKDRFFRIVMNRYNSWKDCF